ncbi:centrosomal protein of 55 kDa-like [Electrophorus electricus]|uniref:centrosomal protein of 55 kDa-like n=1 Tax=Electrophorus electricus TaxID=8005 RepID=UPI0015D025BD|nr:centrosomal protein of 55 kDa-like [Electrophorus electricus]XP_026880770.2 centrosomal protein of 55 kDa-like [Electrophorus electricus]XP_026880771.2 centrosomal protein of 55 kDa-like [Electrophorus electricus]XP_026880772.2 centrosomal protein of 55 kDa-like [Electrophorus electricus]XP_026880773.2 centrosomal protein of 55 kDa-like [Electrophorus electricus]
MAFKISKGKTDMINVRLPNPQIENKITKQRKENAYMKKSLDELSRHKGAPSDSENNQLLLERILALETLREKNSQQILSKDQEIAALRQHLCSDSAEIVTRLQAQLTQQKLDAEMRENLFQSLKQETEELKTNLVVISAKCQDLENTVETAKGGSAGWLPANRHVAVMEEHLKDALEKNQQWLAYDQQREAYVRAVVEKTHQLEQQLSQANEALQQKDRKACMEALKNVESLRSAHAELEVEQEKTEQGRHCEEKQWEAQRQAEKERKHVEEHLHHLHTSLADASAKLEEERLRSSVLLEQVNHFQKVLLTQQNEQNRMSVLEQQIQVSAKDLEDEKRDNQHLQRQLHKILKELRKSKDKVARLECEKAQTEKPLSSIAYTEVEKATKGDLRSHASPTKAHNLLNESFLECPNCRAQYPTSRHRELLVHIDECFD